MIHAIIYDWLRRFAVVVLLLLLIGCSPLNLQRSMDCSQLVDQSFQQRSFNEIKPQNIVEQFRSTERLSDVEQTEHPATERALHLRVVGMWQRMPQDYLFYFQNDTLMYVQAYPTVFIRDKAVFPTIANSIKCIGVPDFYDAFYYKRSAWLYMWYPEEQIVITAGSGYYQDYSEKEPPKYDDQSTVNIIHYSQIIDDQGMFKLLYELRRSEFDYPTLETMRQKRAWPDKTSALESINLSVVD